jgi:hypothetical protein
MHRALLTTIKSHTSNRYLKHPPRLRRSERDDSPERAEGLGYLMMNI